MKRITSYIFVVFLIIWVSGCGPKPKVDIEPVSRAEYEREASISPIAFYHYMNGVIAELEENYELALSYYLTAMGYAPDSYDIRTSLARLYMGRREYDKAWTNLEVLDNRYTEAVLLKADCQRALGNWDQAIKYYKMVQVLDPGELASYWFLGNYYSRVNEVEKAIEQYEVMVRFNDNIQIVNDLAELYIRAGEFNKAIETYKRSLEIDSTPVNRDGYINLSEIYRQTEKLDSAQLYLEGFIDLYPDDVTVHLRLVEVLVASQSKEEAMPYIDSLGIEYENQSQVLGQLGLFCLDLNEIKRAESFFKKQAELDQVNFYPQYYLGRIAMYNQEFEKAKDRFYNVIDLADSIADGWLNLAEIYRLQDSMDMSLDILQQGMQEVTLGKDEIQKLLARYYSAQERYQAVVNVLEGVVDSTTEDIAVLFTLGAALERVGQVDSSIVVFEQLLEVDPNFHPALNYLGYIFADLGIRLPESKKMLELALEHDSTNAAYLDSYGWVMFKMGDLEKAEKYIKKALEFSSKDVEIYDHLAEIYYAQGRYEDARRVWEQALGIDPDNVAIREKLDR